MALSVTVSSVVSSLAPERGVVLALCSGDVSAELVKPMRSSGVSLRVLGLLSALLLAKSKAGSPEPSLSGQRILPSGSTLEVVVDVDLYPVVVEYVSTGRVLASEAVGALAALAKQVEVLSSRDVSVVFVSGAASPSFEQSARLEVEVARARSAEALRQEEVAAWELPAADAAWVAETGATVVYTDGSSLPKEGFSSWAWRVDGTLWGAGTVAAASSSYVERRAVLEALRAVDGPVLVVSDFDMILPEPSARVFSRMEARVLKSLRRLVGVKQVRFLHVKGHAVCPGNLAVDALASGTLTSTWGRVSSDLVVRDRLVSLSRAYKANLVEERRVANERRQAHELRYGASVSARRKARAERKEARAARRARQAESEAALVAA